MCLTSPSGTKIINSLLSPLVSVITANYNKGSFIAETITSIINQTYTNWELMLVDDCSTDQSVEVISPFLEDKRIRLVRNSVNKGGNFCRNLALGLATGQYVVFLDADDLLAAMCLEKRIAAATRHSQANLLIFSMGVFRSRPGDLATDWVPSSRDPLKDLLQHDLPWSILQPIWKREYLLQLGGFDESFLRLQDVELNTRALLDKQVNYKLFPGTPDCYYRVDEARKNYNAADFLGRWVASALKYCDKMKTLVPARLARFLPGTIYQTYYQVIYHFRQGLISKEEFSRLEHLLLGNESMVRLGVVKQALLVFSKWYNLHCFRIPGLNRFLRACIVI